MRGTQFQILTAVPMFNALRMALSRAAPQLDKLMERAEAQYLLDLDSIQTARVAFHANPLKLKRGERIGAAV